MLDKVSSYHLIHELNLQGKAGIYPNLEPIDTDAIIHELSNRSGWEHSTDILQWIEWFLTEEGHATAEQKLSLSTMKRITEIERRALKKLGIDPKL